jgi:hypothetical protein
MTIMVNYIILSICLLEWVVRFLGAGMENSRLVGVGSLGIGLPGYSLELGLAFQEKTAIERKSRSAEI